MFLKLFSFSASPSLRDQKQLHCAVAVGTALAGRPPHRSGHEALPHPAPTSGMTQRLSAPRICFRSLDKLSLSLCTEPVGLNQIPLGQVPSLHHLRQSMASQFLVAGPLFGGFPGTMNLSDCSTAYLLGLRPWPSPAGLAAKLTASRSRALPVPVHGASAHATGL